MDSVEGFPLTVGKAVKDDQKVRQPKAAEIGLVPELAFRWMFTGPSNSGKTNLARFVLDKYYSNNGRSVFDKIYLFSPTAKLDPVWKDLAGLRDADRVTELANGGKEKLHEIFEKAKRRTKALGKDKAPHELVILDDAIANIKFMNSPDTMNLYIAGRHGNLSNMILTQSYAKVPRTYRMQMTALSMFPSRVTEIERLWDEHGPISMKKRDFIDMVKFATQKTESEKYPFFFVDTTKPEETRYRKNLNVFLSPRDNNNNAEPEEKKRRLDY